MAEATADTVTTVVLTLNEEEAWFLADVMSCIGGDPSKSRRKHETAIAAALKNIGFHFEQSPYRDAYGVSDLRKSDSTLMFKSQ